MSRNRKRRRTAWSIHTLDDNDDEKSDHLTEREKIQQKVRHTDYVSLASGIATQTTFFDIPGPPDTNANFVDTLPGLMNDDDVSSISETGYLYQFTDADEEEAEASRRRRTASVRPHICR